MPGPSLLNYPTNTEEEERTLWIEKENYEEREIGLSRDDDTGYSGNPDVLNSDQTPGKNICSSLFNAFRLTERYLTTLRSATTYANRMLRFQIEPPLYILLCNFKGAFPGSRG